MDNKDIWKQTLDGLGMEMEVPKQKNVVEPQCGVFLTETLIRVVESNQDTTKLVYGDSWVSIPNEHLDVVKTVMEDCYRLGYSDSFKNKIK